MPPFVEIDAGDLRDSMRRMEAELRRPAPVYGKAARLVRDYVRQTITLQGRKTKYFQLSKWTKARTNRRKALITLRPLIKAAWDSIGGYVYFQQTDKKWHVDDHHTGFTSKAVTGKRMVVPRKGGGIVAVFMNRKEVKVPSREVWPTQGEVDATVTPVFTQWTEANARRNWR